jgi:4-hydroxybenzoate polyprenyltransferase
MVNLPTQKEQRQIISLIVAAIKIARPVHWIKNLSVFAAIFLTGYFFDKAPFIKTTWAFIAFCFTTSATYIINDIFDRKTDRLHPTKKYRPIASGALPIPLALAEAVFFIFCAISIIRVGNLDPIFLTIILIYLALQLIYSLGLKNIAILDIIIIAIGFILRVYAGAFVINAHLSVWFLLCVISVALFLASGKRRAELSIIQNAEGLTRKSLGGYQKDLLNSYVTMFGNASWMSWALFTFFESPRASLPFWLVLAELSKTTTIGKLLMFTIPVTIFGIMRYESLIFQGKSETPEKLLLTDKALIVAVGLWVILVYWVLYSGISIIQ